MVNTPEWFDRPVRPSRDPWPMRHPVTGRVGEWRGRYRAADERTPDDYETDEEWVEFCQAHLNPQPCAVCEAASLGTDEGAE